jgi:AcrR family transcriptional regulator
MKSPRRPAVRPPSPRERILAAARELFYRDGIRAVGVDAIAAAAQTNKMTLYRQFASKDELVAEYLGELAADGDARWEALRAEFPGDAQAQLRAVLRRVSEFAGECNGRGCALANAAVELPELNHPARKIIEAHKARQMQRLAQLCREAGVAKPERLADEIFLLIEGARVSVQSFGREGPGSRLYALAEGLLAAAPRKDEGGSKSSAARSGARRRG